jgi:hypothetical protein
MKYIHFFATKNDILPMIEAVEQQGPLQYVRTGNRLSSDFEKYLHGADIPNLGRASRDSASSCEHYLVTPATVPISVETFEGIGGVQRYCMDQSLNPDTVELTPAGVWGDDFVLDGRVATISGTAIAQGLMKRFHTAITKRFTKVRAFWVGPEALALLRAGKRLTAATQCPPEFDLCSGPPDPATDEMA